MFIAPLGLLLACIASAITTVGVIAIANDSVLAAGAAVLLCALAFLPRVAFALFLISDAFILVFLLGSPGLSTIYATGASILGLWSAVVLTVTHAGVRERFRRVWLPLLLLLALGLIFSMQGTGLQQTAIGVRLFFLPVIAYVVAPAFSASTILHVIRVCAVAVTISNAVAVWQIATGASGLLSAGLQYGGSVRTVDSILRPPGLFVASYVYGGFSAVTAVIMVALVLRLGWRRLGPLWMLLAGSCVAGVVLSTSRFALIIVVVGLIVAVIFPSHLPVWPKLVVTVIGFAAVFGFAVTGVTGTESFDARVNLWTTLLADSSFPLGDGWGSAGSATLSQFSSSVRIADSYYVSLALQLGVFSIPLLALGWLFAVRKLSRFAQAPLAWAAACAFVGVLISFFLTESWEYTGAASLMMLVIGADERNQPALPSLVSTAAFQKSTLPAHARPRSTTPS